MGATWRLALLLETMQSVPGMNEACVPEWASESPSIRRIRRQDARDRVDAGLEEATRAFAAVEGRILELGLDECWGAKPPVNGQDVMAALNMTKGGRNLKNGSIKPLNGCWKIPTSRRTSASIGSNEGEL